MMKKEEERKDQQGGKVKSGLMCVEVLVQSTMQVVRRLA